MVTAVELQQLTASSTLFGARSPRETFKFYLTRCIATTCALQCDELVAEGAVAASSPAEVVQQADITFGMLADPEAALKVCRFSN
jgi:hypothetical protein